MTKKELFKVVVDRYNETLIDEKSKLSYREFNNIWDVFENTIKENVIFGGEVSVPGICRIKVKDSPQRTGTVQFGASKGEQWVKPAHKEPIVKAATSLKNIFH